MFIKNTKLEENFWWKFKMLWYNKLRKIHVGVYLFTHLVRSHKRGEAKLKITDGARDLLKQALQEQNASGLRVYFAGFGWGGPQIGLALDEPEADDKVVTENEIQVAYENSIEPYAEDLVLEYDEEREGLVLVGNESYC